MSSSDDDDDDEESSIDTEQESVQYDFYDLLSQNYHRIVHTLNTMNKFNLKCQGYSVKLISMEALSSYKHIKQDNLGFLKYGSGKCKPHIQIDIESCLTTISNTVIYIYKTRNNYYDVNGRQHKNIDYWCITFVRDNTVLTKIVQETLNLYDATYAHCKKHLI